MIIVKVHGGLGNQMFQYAFGRNLSLVHAVPLRIDSSYLRAPNQSGRSPGLNALALSVPEATAEEIKAYLGMFPKLADRFRPPHARKHIRESQSFDTRLLRVADAYVEGHWQNEQYFRANKETVRRDFTLKNPLREGAQKALSRITASRNATALHIRRGDYVSIKKIADVHGTLPLSYYETAMKTVLAGFPDAHFFISSDDMAWVKTHFPKGFPISFLSEPSIADYEELVLMSLCKHQIIANSTYSWWAAWLNRNPEKIVIAPKNWFTDTTPEPKGLIPNTWVRL